MEISLSISCTVDTDDDEMEELLSDVIETEPTKFAAHVAPCSTNAA